MEKEVVIVPITGRRGSGKDSIARIAIEKFRCAGSVALSTWFKTLLSAEFKIPIEDFHSSKKDEPFARPIVIGMSNLRRLKSAMSAQSGKGTDISITKIPVGRWDGRQIDSIRDLMVWFAHEFVTVNLGDQFHNEMTDKLIEAIPLTERYNVIFVTDARQFKQSVYYSKRYKHFYPIHVSRPTGPQDTSAPEVATDEFPQGYFFARVINDGSIEKLEAGVLKLLQWIRRDLNLEALPIAAAPEVELESEEVALDSLLGDLIAVDDAVNAEIAKSRCHPRYSGVRTPRSDCKGCWALYKSNKENAEYNSAASETTPAAQSAAPVEPTNPQETK